MGKLDELSELYTPGQELPFDIREIYVFGSFARGKDEPRDLDLIMIHEQLTEAQIEQMTRALEGYGTSLEQQMNHKLKSNRENIDIVYAPNWEVVIRRMKIKPSASLKIQTKDDHAWKEKLVGVHDKPTNEQIRTLEKELESTLEYVRRLENNPAAYERAIRDANIAGTDLTRIQQARIAAFEEIKKREKLEPFVPRK